LHDVSPKSVGGVRLIDGTLPRRAVAVLKARATEPLHGPANLVVFAVDMRAGEVYAVLTTVFGGATWIVFPPEVAVAVGGRAVVGVALLWIDAAAEPVVAVREAPTAGVRDALVFAVTCREVGFAFTRAARAVLGVTLQVQGALGAVRLVGAVRDAVHLLGGQRVATGRLGVSS